MTTADKILSALYGAVALAALIGTQTALIRHISTYDGNLFSGFLKDMFANPAATFGAIDLIVVALAALVFVVVEGRRLGMRHLWAYVALTFLVAISVALPTFLAVRQMRLADVRTTAQGAAD